MELKIQKECTLCSKSFGWNEIMFTKLPENAAFCDTCIHKFKDDTQYKGDACWFTSEWGPDITFYNKSIK